MAAAQADCDPFDRRDAATVPRGLRLASDTGEFREDPRRHVATGSAANLGEPADASGASFLGLSSREAVWKDNRTTITVRFLNDRVVGKQMLQNDKKGTSQRDEKRR